jgi:hypothetical protein
LCNDVKPFEISSLKKVAGRTLENLPGKTGGIGSFFHSRKRGENQVDLRRKTEAEEAGAEV